MSLDNASVLVSASTLGQTLVLDVQRSASSGRIIVTRFMLITAGAVSVKFQSGNTDITGPMRIAADGNGLNDDCGNHSSGGLFYTNPGEPLRIYLDTAVAVGGYLSYRLDSGVPGSGS